MKMHEVFHDPYSRYAISVTIAKHSSFGTNMQLVFVYIDKYNRPIGKGDIRILLL